MAWTKLSYARRFFGINVGPMSNDAQTPVPTITPSKANPEDFRFLCPDATLVVIDEKTKPCTWAARPWQGYVANGGVTDIDSVQKVRYVIDTFIYRIPKLVRSVVRSCQKLELWLNN